MIWKAKCCPVDLTFLLTISQQ